MHDFSSPTQRRLLSLIQRNAPITRAELAELSGLTPAAITKITKKMLLDGLLTELGKQKNKRGQPGIEIGIQQDYAYSLGINIELEKISIELVDFAGESISSHSISGIFSSPELAIPELTALFEVMKITHSDALSKLIGVGITTSCNFEHNTGALIMPPHLKAWEDPTLTERISQYFQVPCWIDNDANAASLGEFICSKKQNDANFFYLYLGYGIGGGHFHSGNAYRGAHNNAGRIGKLFPDLTNRPSLTCLYEELGLPEPSPFREQSLDGLLDSNKERVDQWLDKTHLQLISALYYINAICDPEEIIIGGLLPNKLLNQLCKMSNQHFEKLNNPEQPMPILTPAMISGNKVAATGAAMIPLYKLAY
ncbi:ROK family transcriptional regulator [Vibrio sp. SS-MA-C1-2]|uniref:ROK family transcriptional regulator n=1 Tax=Vibrio sp. SS-MA-C1-2 TaxID=2908646 RepID=UPI001F1B1F83|nr:ROK family transcriptional regulator [Vibrio sp. SS-MA-C1-2]UJF17982.1 ROK family transcriptional regulator [Vibrio sp. SS-MA-C1-2]